MPDIPSIQVSQGWEGTRSHAVNISSGVKTITNWTGINVMQDPAEWRTGRLRCHTWTKVCTNLLSSLDFEEQRRLKMPYIKLGFVVRI